VLISKIMAPRVQPDLPQQLTSIEYLFGDEVSWALGAMIFEINTNDL